MCLLIFVKVLYFGLVSCFLVGEILMFFVLVWDMIVELMGWIVCFLIVVVRFKIFFLLNFCIVVIFVILG